MSTESRQLSAIQYKTGLSSDNLAGTDSGIVQNISKILDTEMVANKDKSWSRLDKTTKIVKLRDFVRDVCAEKYGFDPVEADNCCKYLVKNLNTSLRRVKDISYDMEAGTVTGIPGLTVDEATRAPNLRRESSVRTNTFTVKPIARGVSNRRSKSNARVVAAMDRANMDRTNDDQTCNESTTSG